LAHGLDHVVLLLAISLHHECLVLVEGDEVSFSQEVVRRIYDDSEGVFIEVGPDGDGLGGIEIRTTNAESKEFYGDIRCSIHSKEQAILIGKAILAAAEDM
jgi:hypothetical protein